MGYSLDFNNSAAVGPLFGAPVTSGNVNVGGNPNLAQLTSVAASLTQNPLTLIIGGALVLAGLWLYLRSRK